MALSIKYKSDIKDITEDINGKKLQFRGNSAFRPANTKLGYTREQLEEYKKCSEDPIYFINHYVAILRSGKGFGIVTLRKYQEDLIKLLMTSNRVAILLPRQFGKCLHFTTKIKIRNKKTVNIKNISIGRFYIEQKIKSILLSMIRKLFNRI